MLEEDNSDEFNRNLASNLEIRTNPSVKERESIYEDHTHQFDENLKKQMLETFNNFDCSKNLVDSLILQKIQGLENENTIVD